MQAIAAGGVDAIAHCLRNEERATAAALTAAERGGDGKPPAVGARANAEALRSDALFNGSELRRCAAGALMALSIDEDGKVAIFVLSIDIALNTDDAIFSICLRKQPFKLFVSTSTMLSSCTLPSPSMLC
jgi:hypothetical protein